jgi:hypothetical protein
MIAQGTGTSAEALVFDYPAYSGGDTISFRMWLETGIFEKAGIQVFNQTQYNE